MPARTPLRLVTGLGTVGPAAPTNGLPGRTPSVSRRSADGASEPVASTLTTAVAQEPPPCDDHAGDDTRRAPAAKPLARHRRVLPAADDDDAWQELLAEKQLPRKDERLSTILSLAAHSTSQVARRPDRDGAVHVELLDAAQELLRAMQVQKALREDERRPAQTTKQPPPCPHARRCPAPPAVSPPRTERCSSPDRISSVLSGLEMQLRQSLGATASAIAASCASSSGRPSTTPATARGFGSAVKALARKKSPQRPSTAREARLPRQYQAWRHLTPAHSQDPEEDQLFLGWATGAGAAAENAAERLLAGAQAAAENGPERRTPTSQRGHQAAARREALRRVREQVSSNRFSYCTPFTRSSSPGYESVGTGCLNVGQAARLFPMSCYIAVGSDRCAYSTLLARSLTPPRSQC